MARPLKPSKKIVTRGGPSGKLARAKRRDTRLCAPESMVHSDKELLKEMESAWSKDWKKL